MPFNRITMTSLAAILGIFFLAGSVSHAKDAIVVTEADGTQKAFTKNGLIDFTDDYQNNPRNLTLNILDHIFTFSATQSGGQTTGVRFVSQEMGIDQTFTGGTTGDTVNNLKNFLKSNDFLGPFINLINTGAGAQISGTPTGSINRTASVSLNQVKSTTLTTADEKEGGAQLGGVELAAGFTQFDSNGFRGKSTGGSPGYSWKLGDFKDRRFNLTLPVEVITLEGLQTYRVGIILQYIRPFYLTRRLTLRVGPDVSYSVIGSLDIPNISGTIGGAMTTTLTQDWEKYILSFGGYYGRYQSLGGIPTHIQANIGAYGLQLGRRVGQKSIVSVFGEDTVNNVLFQPLRVYHTVGAAFTHRLLGRWSVTVGGAKVLGIPGYDGTEITASSQWKF